MAVALAKLAVARQRRSQAKDHLLQLHTAHRRLESLRVSEALSGLVRDFGRLMTCTPSVKLLVCEIDYFYQLCESV